MASIPVSARFTASITTYEAYDLFQFGVIATKELAGHSYRDLNYDLVLEHERNPFVSYPHEWSASMLKDAALLHIDLFGRLGSHGLILEDWHPYNILFNGPKPIFVDFCSIIPTDTFQRGLSDSASCPAAL